MPQFLDLTWDNEKNIVEIRLSELEGGAFQMSSADFRQLVQDGATPFEEICGSDFPTVLAAMHQLLIHIDRLTAVKQERAKEHRHRLAF